MPEGESGPEIPKSTPEQTERKPEKEATPSFEGKIKGLIEPLEEGKESVIANKSLQRLAKLATQSRNQTPERLEEFLKKGDEWFADGQVPEEEWAILGGLINEKLEEVRAAQPKEAISPPEVKIDLKPLEQFFALSQRQTQDLADSLRRLSPEKERERWIDVEYKQEFYTRFTPTLEPRFYTELPHEERELFEARWQLARAAYWKKAYSAFPEKQFENQDLQLLRIEQMERLYKMPGVRKGLEWYANEIVNGQVRIPVKDERGNIPILGCKDESEFERFREIMREYLISKGIVKEKWQAREVDAVAWNWIWCSNLVESMDSRHALRGGSGGRNDHLAGVLVSDDLRATFHSQEKFEDKSRKGQEWGAFGKWGVAQIRRIAGETGFNKDKDEIEFKAATSPSQFWTARRTSRSSKEGGIVIEVYAPECYPTTSMRSFWEETKIDGTPFLDYLLKGEPIHWRELEFSDPWIGYLPIKLRLAVGLLEYFKPGKPMETQRFGYVKTWADPLIDVYTRLKLKDKPSPTAFRNLKVWAVYAAYGGVGHVDRTEPTINLGTLDRGILSRALRDKNVRYLEGKESLKIA